MKRQIYYYSGFIFIFAIIALAGTGNLVSAQANRKDQRSISQNPSSGSNQNQQRDNNQNQQKQDRSMMHQDQYRQLQTQNQQRFEQRQQSYQDFHQQRMNNRSDQNLTIQNNQNNKNVTIQNNQNNKIITTQMNPPPNREQRQIIQNQNRTGDQIQNRYNADRRSEYDRRQINDRERQQIQIQTGNWDRNERGWQSQYNNRWQQQQNLYNRQIEILRRQNRNAQYAFQEAYWNRVREDRDRLQNWQFYNDVALDYSYLRGGRYYYTSQYGLNLLNDAVGDGYQEGFLAGQADREDNNSYDFRDAFAFQDASYGYNGYWVDLSEYQYYFRQGFQNGYSDGFYERSQYGTYTNGNYAVNASFLHGLLNFTYVGR